MLRLKHSSRSLEGSSSSFQLAFSTFRAAMPAKLSCHTQWKLLCQCREKSFRPWVFLWKTFDFVILYKAWIPHARPICSNQDPQFVWSATSVSMMLISGKVGGSGIKVFHTTPKGSHSHTWNTADFSFPLKHGIYSSKHLYILESCTNLEITLLGITLKCVSGAGRQSKEYYRKKSIYSEVQL